ncbi:MAG: aminodeoxychorismate synthase component I [Lachnospiraceae bacterium]|nr:aminodeoxychorismate synthase component I [Lachnospiraceae bacterium]
MILRKYDTACSLYDIFSCLHQEEDAVFLDSSLKNQYGRFSIAGFLPEMKAEEKDGIFYLNEQPQQMDCMAWLKAYLAKNREENPTALPFVSGGIGYLTYDYGKRFMGLPHVHPKNIDMADCRFVFYRLYLIEETQTGEITIAARDEEAVAWLKKKERESAGWLCASAKECKCAEHAEAGQNEITSDFAEAEQNEVTSDFAKAGQNEVTSDFAEDDYKDAIQKMVDYIVAGDIYITNMTRQIEIRSQAEPYEIFRFLRKNNPSPFGGYFNYKDVEIVSASPERFFEIRDKVIRTRPIKGTRKRGATPEEDEMLRLELQNSEKDKSELLMIVDLERNDLSRVCEANSVKVEELFVTEAYATVFHLVSTICGKLHAQKDLVDVLEAMFPGGSITGAPKYRSMEIIDELEHSRRMLYTGSMGYIGFDGNCDFNIVIRTLVHQGDCYHIGAGGGITCESEPDFEYEETCQKAMALIDAAAKAADILQKGQEK